MWNGLDPDCFIRHNGFTSSKSKLSAAERYRGQVARACHNSKHEIESKLRQFGRKIKSILEKIRSDLECKLKTLRGNVVIAEADPEARSAGSALIQAQSDMIQV